MKNANNDFYFKFVNGNRTIYFNFDACKKYVRSNKLQRLEFIVYYFDGVSITDLIFINARFQNQLLKQAKNYLGYSYQPQSLNNYFYKPSQR